MSNKIPRKFNTIVGKVLVETNLDKINDILNVYKNDSGYLTLNNRTQHYAYWFVSMLRNENIFEILEII